MPVRSLPEALYSADQTRELDRLAGEAGLSGEELMERAGRAAFDVLLSRWPDVSRPAVLCGGGLGQTANRQTAKGLGLLAFAKRAQAAENLAAARNLTDQQFGIFHVRAVGRQVAFKLARNNGNCRQRRAELMRGSGGERAQRREALLL